MKKNIYKSLILLFAIINFSSCKKEVLQNKVDNVKKQGVVSNSGPYFAENGRLIIESVDVFEDLIQSADYGLYNSLNNLDYTSYFDYTKGVRENTIKDEFLSYILNKDQVVQINNYLYRIDKKDKEVFVLPVSHSNNYEDLVNENTANGYLLKFTTDDDVFELLSETNEMEEKFFKKKCAPSNQAQESRKYADWIDTDAVYGHENRRYKFHRKIKVRYDNWGIYRKLFTEFKHWETLWGTWDETHFTINHTASWKTKQGNTGQDNNQGVYNYWNYLWHTGTSGWLGPFYENNAKKREIIHYRSTKCLRYYDLKAHAWFRNRETRTPELAPSSGGQLHIYHN